MSDFDKELDTSGLNCPLPIIKAKKEINTMEVGQVLHVISTDPGAVMDFESLLVKQEMSFYHPKLKIINFIFL